MDPLEEDYKSTMKIVIVGDGEVGKTCMCAAYTNGKFPEDYVPTVFDNFVAPALIDEKPVNVILWDTAGQEEYDRLRPLSYTSTDVILVCFSVVSPVSYENVEKKWIPEVQHYCPKAVMFIVGTKADLRLSTTDTFLKFEDGERLAENCGAAGYLECSAITQDGLKDVFHKAMRSVLYENPKYKDKKCRVM